MSLPFPTVLLEDGMYVLDLGDRGKFIITDDFEPFLIKIGEPLSLYNRLAAAKTIEEQDEILKLLREREKSNG